MPDINMEGLIPGDIYGAGASDEQAKTLELIKQNTILCEASCNAFKQRLVNKIFEGGKETVSWKRMYYSIKSFGIYASKTTIWNLFLDAERKVLTEAEDVDSSLQKVSETFKVIDVTDDRAHFLFHMTESYKKWKTKRMIGWKPDMVADMITRKFLQGKGCNFFCAAIIAVVTILLITVSVFPMGEGIFDTVWLCNIVVATYAVGFFWYLFSLLGERWYPSTYGGLGINAIFTVGSFMFCVLFFHYVANPGYYENQGCFKCPVCTETNDKLCYEYNSFYASVNNEYAEANTCSCALVERLRINEPIIPYGEFDSYCGGNNCSCPAILTLSTENWGVSQEYYTCVFFSQKGTFFFYLGTLTGVAMLVDFMISSWSFFYWFMMWLGCGTGVFSNCVCCGIDFDMEQRRAVSKLRQMQD